MNVNGLTSVSDETFLGVAVGRLGDIGSSFAFGPGYAKTLFGGFVLRAGRRAAAAGQERRYARPKARFRLPLSLTAQKVQP